MSANNGSRATETGAATANVIWGGAPGPAEANIKKAATATSQDMEIPFRPKWASSLPVANPDRVNARFTA